MRHNANHLPPVVHGKKTKPNDLYSNRRDFYLNVWLSAISVVLFLYTRMNLKVAEMFSVSSLPHYTTGI